MDSNRRCWGQRYIINANISPMVYQIIPERGQYGVYRILTLREVERLDGLVNVAFYDRNLAGILLINKVEKAVAKNYILDRIKKIDIWERHILGGN